MSKKKKSMIIIAVIAGIIVSAGLAVLGYFLFSPRSNPQYVAHQGYRDLYLGNTAEAFRAAAASTFYGIETDVHETADGVIVCHHDDEVILPDGNKRTIATSTYAELTATQLKEKKSGELFTLCTFAEYLEICKSGDKVALIELKESCDEAKLTHLLAEIDSIYDRKKVSIISFDLDNLIRMQAIAPSISLQYLSETKKDPAFDTCLEKGISVSVKTDVLTKRLVKAFHERGLTVNVWTVNKKISLTIARIKGVDYVTTDLFHEEEGKIVG